MTRDGKRSEQEMLTPEILGWRDGMKELLVAEMETRDDQGWRQGGQRPDVEGPA